MEQQNAEGGTLCCAAFANEMGSPCLASINFAQVLHCQGGTRKIHLSRLSPENSHLDTLAADEPVKRLDKSSKDFW